MLRLDLSDFKGTKEWTLKEKSGDLFSPYEKLYGIDRPTEQPGSRLNAQRDSDGNCCGTRATCRSVLSFFLMSLQMRACMRKGQHKEPIRTSQMDEPRPTTHGPIPRRRA